MLGDPGAFEHLEHARRGDVDPAVEDVAAEERQQERLRARCIDTFDGEGNGQVGHLASISPA